MKVLALAIVMGGVVFCGTYFLLPPPQTTQACDLYDVKQVVKQAIRECLNGSQSDENFEGFKIYTNC